VATGIVFSLAILILVCYQVLGRRFHRRKDLDKASLLSTLEGDWVVVLRKRKRALFEHQGRVEASRLERGTLLLHDEACDHVLAVADIKYVTVGERRWGPL
jgi:hypothetical protein